MSDGTTATTLAPSEEKMNEFAHMFTDMFGSMRDKVLEASKLASDVADLRKAVGDMRIEVDHLREQNRWLDEQVTTLRVARDNALSQVEQVSRERNAAQDEVVRLNQQTDNQRSELERLQTQITTLRKERDDAQFEGLRLDERNKELSEKLSAIQAVFGVPKAAEPEQQPDFAKPVEVPKPEQPRDEDGKFQSWDQGRYDRTGSGW